MTDDKVKQLLSAVLATVTQQTIRGNSSITFGELTTAPVHPQLKAFLTAELERAAHAALIDIKSTRFNYTDASLVEPRRAFAGAVVRTASLLRSDFMMLLENAAILELGYLFRPQQILTDFLFGSDGERSAAEIIDRIRDFSDYSYLTGVLMQYLEKKQVQSLTRERFSKLIADIDRKVVLSYEKEEFLMLLKPIYDFLELAQEQEASTELLAAFFEEKGLAEISKLFDAAYQQGLRSLTIYDVNELFDGKGETVARRKRGLTQAPEPTSLSALPEPVNELLEPANELPEPEDELPDLPELPEPPPLLELPPLPDLQALPAPVQTAQTAEVAHHLYEMPKASPVNSNEQLPGESFEEYLARQGEAAFILDDSNVEALPANPEADLSVFSKVEVKPAPPPKIEASPELEKLSKEAALAKPQVKSDGLPDLRLLISDEDRKKIIRRVFKGSEPEYDRAVMDINEKKNWRDASLYIDEEVFLKHKVDEYTHEAVLFTDIVFSRYKNVKM